MKTCSRCNKEKEKSQFYKNKRYKDGLYSWCKSCTKEYNKLNRKTYVANVETKFCKTCDKIKLFSQFSKGKYSKDGLDNRCKQCKKLYDHKKRKFYEKDKYENDINFKLIKNIRNRTRIAIKNNQKVGSAIQDLGCSIDDLKLHLEFQFQLGMTWDNHGRKGWHIDHIKPLSKFDLADRKQFLEACHYTNLQPLWEKDNILKWSHYEEN